MCPTEAETLNDDDAYVYIMYLLTTLDRNLVKPQDVKVVLAMVAANPEGQLMAWRHLKAHWHYMQSVFGNGTFTMGGLISAVTSHFSTDYDYHEENILFLHAFAGYDCISAILTKGTIALSKVQDKKEDLVELAQILKVKVSLFFKDMNVGSGQRALKQSLEMIRLNIHWVRHNEEAIYAWLNNYLLRNNTGRIPHPLSKDKDLLWSSGQSGRVRSLALLNFSVKQCVWNGVTQPQPRTIEELLKSRNSSSGLEN
uniref:ERAP1-like C-terminal domain-containing protein n=1 Tax=Timema cristinae TaxID=61476 RepID=A0A7R9D4P4_TIMCR|nr:unnamed protein product [Timema cristinae]